MEKLFDETGWGKIEETGTQVMDESMAIAMIQTRKNLSN
jgi:hypothetical protein